MVGILKEAFQPELQLLQKATRSGKVSSRAVDCHQQGARQFGISTRQKGTQARARQSKPEQARARKSKQGGRWVLVTRGRARRSNVTALQRND